MNFKKINNFLIVLIVLVNGYVLLAPFTPQLIFWWQSRSGDQAAALTQAVRSQPNAVSGQTSAANEPVVNNLIVPSMLLDQPVYEGSIKDTYKTLDKGIWRWPNGSTPDKGGNTVLLGHRFTYTQPKGVLYFLNKVAAGDELAVTWNGVRYVYKVSEVKVVSPNDTSILSPTDDSQLTIYTCTPLWKPTDRLVVIAKLEQS